ncbi:TetR/AcrR family transcriptional regulator [Nocardiopsis sp. NRRL B-16309]|uniref:TetR/AcrR family transcriptional regulator n=1 Tax=Nocardiopsis sp. NRRL B-16309 TaxID=1519494 RepID=UPI0006AE1173|nr:TetR family transcriptional regulator [Nocardiopsis sp. NRRL B-16309]
MERPRNPLSPVTGRRRPGRPASLTVEAVTSAALRVGFRSLSVSAVARDLGVNHATLYRYVESRAHLAGLALDRVVEGGGEWPGPEGRTWREYLEATVWTVWDLLDAHPGLAGEVNEAVPTSKEFVRHVNLTARGLTEYGFTPSDAFLACDIVMDLAFDSHDGWELMDDADGQDSLRDRMSSPGMLALLDPPLREAVHDMLAGPPREWFDRKLQVCLDGIGARLAPR